MQKGANWLTEKETTQMESVQQLTRKMLKAYQFGEGGPSRNDSYGMNAVGAVDLSRLKSADTQNSVGLGSGAGFCAGKTQAPVREEAP
jgi:hypothetical protein